MADRERILFVPDAHLKDPKDENYRAMIEFLGKIAPTATTIVIIGDLFDFWAGYRKPPKRYEPIIEGLISLSRRGIKIHYTEGNHDFFMGPVFTDKIGAVVHPGPWEIETKGKRIYIAHGDEVNRKDYGYLTLRWVLRSLPVKILLRITPLFVVEMIASAMSRASRIYTDAKTDDIDLITKEFARARFREGYDAVVLGHSHISKLQETESGKRRRTYVNVGRWMGGRYDYVEFYGGRFRGIMFNNA